MSRSLKTFLLAAALLALIAGSSSAAVFKVKAGGSPPFFTNLDTALFTANTYGPGPHQIEVYPGTYNTDIDLTVPLTIDMITGMDTGVYFVNPAPPTVIDPTKNFLDVAGTNGLTISGLHISGYNGGIVTVGAMATDLVVEDCVFEDNIVGLYLGANGGTFDNLEVIGGWQGFGLNSLNSAGGENINNNVISNSLFYGQLAAPGIYFTYDEDQFIPGASNAAAAFANNQILNCMVYDGADRGIVVSGATGTTIDGCTIFNMNWAAISVYGSAGGAFENNTIYHCAKDPATTHVAQPSPSSDVAAVGLFNVSGLGFRYNTVYDNGGLGTMGVGSAFADYAVGVAAGSGNTIRYNCLYGHDGVQGLDNGDGTDWWNQNYYSDLTTIPYAVDGTALEADANPNRFNASATTGAATYEVWDVIDMDFLWSLPNCDPVDSVGLASYEFTVTFDQTKLEYVGGSGGYNEDFLGDTAFYAPIDASTPGQVTFGAANFLAAGFGNATLAFGQFEVIGFGSVTVTLNSTYLDINGNPILVTNTPLVLTLEDNGAPTITVVPDNPVGDDTYSDIMDIEITGDVTDNFDLYRVYYAFDGGGWTFVANVDGLTDTYGPFTVDLVGLTEGPHTLNMRVRDQAGNYGYVDYAFTVDNTGPVLTSIALKDADDCAIDAEYTNDPAILIDFVDDGTATEMEFYDAGAPGWQGAIAYASPAAYTLLNTTDGAKLVYARLYDAYGNMGNQVSDAITLDQVASPVTAAWLVSDPTPLYTNTDTIDADANWGVGTGTVEYVLSEDPNDALCGSGAWTAAPPSPRPIEFVLSAGDGLKTVYFASRDLAGNISVVTQQITLDMTAPAFLTFEVPECVNYTTNIPANFTWDDAVDPDVVSIQLGIADPPTGAIRDITGEDPADAEVLFNIGAGTYTIYAVLRDAAGNVSAVASDGILVDLTAPSAGSMALNGGAAWANDPTVTATLSGFDGDIVEVRMSQTSGDYTLSPDNDWVPFDTGNPTVSFTFVAPTEQISSALYLQARDCAGNVSTEAVDGIKFDFTAPVISALLINGGATMTNDALVDIDFSYTELKPLLVYINEDPDMTGITPIAWGPPYTDIFTLSTGDGTKSVFVQIEDRAGNLSNTITANIDLDTQAPTGAFALVQGSNPMAAAGYTSGLVVDVINITHDADVVEIAIRNSDGSNNTGWISPVAGYTPWTLVAGADGPRTVQLALKDGAGNTTMWMVTATIELLTTTPAPATSFVVTPTGSAHLEWTGGPDDQYYFFRYNASFEYPTFESGYPPFPALDEGFFGANVFGTEFDLTTYPEADLLAFSLWTVNNAGIVSAVPATATGVNYIPGDFDWDGTVEFLEFGDIAASYTLATGEAGFIAHADISADVAEDPMTVAAPADGAVGFPDLNKFAQNYAAYGDFGKAAGKAAVLGPVAITAEVPSFVPQNTEFQVSLKVDNPSPILTYHLMFDFDEANFEIVDVAPGNMYDENVNQFFHYNAKSQDIELSGAVFGNVFEGDEIAVVTLRAITGSSFDLSERELTARAIGNEAIDVDFSVQQTISLLPKAFTLHQNYPNPFNPSTTISFDLPKASQYDLVIYNLTGQQITRFSGHAEAGVVSIEWNADDVASGIYFYRLVAGEFTSAKKMVLLK